MATRPEVWEQPWRWEGYLEGYLAVYLEGYREGHAACLTRLLERRFGVLPDAVRHRIAGADLPTLEAWSARLFDAASIDDVLR
jgi:hypothetical protein